MATRRWPKAAAALGGSGLEDYLGGSGLEDILGGSGLEDYLGGSGLEDYLGGSGLEDYVAAQVQKATDVYALLRLRERMKQQLHDCSNVIQSDQIFCIDHIIDQHVIEEYFPNGAAEDLEKNMEELTLNWQNKSLALQRMQFAFQLKNKLRQHDYESRLIIGNMKHITMLSRTVIAYQQQAREKEHKLIDVKKKRLLLKKRGEQKILQIRTMIKKAREKQGHVKRGKMLEIMRRNIQKERQRITVLQNVFQNILIGSKVNWAENPSLKAVVLQFEKNVCLV